MEDLKSSGLDAEDMIDMMSSTFAISVINKGRESQPHRTITYVSDWTISPVAVDALVLSDEGRRLVTVAATSETICSRKLLATYDAVAAEMLVSAHRVCGSSFNVKLSRRETKRLEAASFVMLNIPGV